MTLNSTTLLTRFNGDGSTTEFATDFVIWNSSDLRVILVSSSGSETVWTEGTEYTVTGGDAAVATVTASTSPTDYTPESGETLMLKSNVANLQGTNLPVGGAFNSDNVEEELDRMARRLQQVDEMLDRAPQLTESSTRTGLVVPTPSSGYILGWSSSGNLANFASTSISSSIQVSAFMVGLLDDTTADASLSTLGAMKRGVHSIWIPAGSFVARATQGAASNTVELTTNDVMIKTYDFTASSSVPEAVQFMLAMPKSWNESTFSGEHYWTCVSSSATGDVVWSTRMVGFDNDDAMDASWGTAVEVTDTFLSKHDMHISSAFSGVTPAGTPSTDAMIAIEVSRASSEAADTLAVDASYLGMRLKMTFDAADDS